MTELQEQIFQYFNGVSDVAAVVLFGSVAKGTARTDSDVDLAVLFQTNKEPKALQLLDMKVNLSDLLNKEVDLVCLNTASPIIGIQIYKYGEVILLNDRKVYDRYLIRLFNDYHELKYLRQSAEKSILKRKYYG